MRERSDDGRAQLLASRDTHVYVCGLKSMEAGVLDALRSVSERTAPTGDGAGASSSPKAGCISRRPGLVN